MSKITTRKQYVERLRKMLRQNKACKCCPVIPYFKGIDHPDYRKSRTGDTSCNYGDDTMFWCRDFINLDPNLSDCPCWEIQGDALYRARLAIARWDAGTHKWQQEGKGYV